MRRYPHYLGINPLRYVNVNEMYQFAQANGKPLLSNFEAPFWQDYVANYERYDKVFKRMYKNFRYFDQRPYALDDEQEAIETVTEEFIDEVYNHLLLNKKRYSELYRIWDVPDEEYSITKGYLYNETHTETGTELTNKKEGERTDETERTKGAQTDTETDTHGARTNTNTDEKGKVTITTTNEQGAQSSTSSTAKGSRTDTEELTKGNYTDTVKTEKGSRTDTEDISKAAYADTEVTDRDQHEQSVQTSNQGYTDTTINDKAAFNTSEYVHYDKTQFTHSPDSETEQSIFGPEKETKSLSGGARSEEKSLVTGSQTDNVTENRGSRTESKTSTTGAVTDQVTENKGARSDTGEEVRDAHTDKFTEQLGEYTDTKDYVEGARDDTETFKKGEQNTDTQNEFTRTLTIERDGNIGRESVTDILEKHEKYWNRFNFYKLIFADICKEMLLVE